MKELEDTHCEVKKIVELQYPNWDFLNSFDDENPVAASPRSSGSSNVLGGFLEGANYAWLSSGPKLVVFNTKTGANISSWAFKERISCVSPFPGHPGQLPLLLIGTDNDATRIKESFGMVCIFDCTISQVLRAIKVPAGVEQLCVINGGAEWEEMNERMNNLLIENNNGIACVTLRNLDHLMIDLRRNSWNPLSFPCADESNPAEVDMDTRSTSRHRANREKHSVCNLMNERIERYIEFNRDEFESSPLHQELLTTVIICSRKIGCLISGCLGRIIIWQNDGVVRWISPAMEDNIIVSHLALLEPTDDPRPFCYLWAAYQEDASAYPPTLKMYAVLFERKCSDKGINFYYNLEGEPSLKFEFELEENSKVISLYPIIRGGNQEQTESGNKQGEDSLLLINVDGKSILFDLNQWYKEQLPHFIRECQNSQAILSTYQTKSEISTSCNIIVNCSYIPITLKEFSCANSTPPEEFFFPNSLSFEWVQLGTKKLIIWTTRGVQSQLLREIAMAGPIIIIQPSETYHRCIAAGLISFNSDMPYNNNLDSQREAILTLCLEQRWTTFLLRCAKEWSDGSAAYLYPAFLRWAIQRASTIKLNTHELCITLFDHSGSSIGEAEVKTLRFFSQQMECLSNVVDNMPIEAGDLEHQRRALRRISMYLHILLWFYDVGLLPETQDVDEESLPISFILRIPYPADKLASTYKEKREHAANSPNKKDNEENLFIDELISRECSAIRSQWEQEKSEVNCEGQYPPPSLQSLLRSCLTDCYNPESNEMENKHQIIIYLLMDLVMLLQGSCPGVDQLIKYPSAFKLSPGLIKLTQALFLLDHDDYQGFLDIMTGQMIFESDIKSWHHKLVMRTLLRSGQNKLALIYLRIRKPPLSSIDDQSTVITLSVERGLVQSAFHRRPASHYTELLVRFFRACKAHGKLNDILHLALNNEEEEAFIQFLEHEKCEETRLLYYLQRCRYTEASNVFPIENPVNLQRSNIPASLSMFHAYHATLPAITRRFTSNFNQRNEIELESRYPRPMSHQKYRSKTQDIYETVIKKARETFIRRDRSRMPFLSAPCSSLKSTGDNTDTNCVFFLEPARQLSAKRSLDEMRGEEVREEHLNRKRQKLSDLSKSNNESMREIVSMCNTPLVKRKSQLICTKEVPCETPQSILKIRQLIRDSASPAGKVSSSQDDKVLEKEKKPRQIRFSINQPKIEDSSVEEMAVDDIEKTMDVEELSEDREVNEVSNREVEQSQSVNTKKDVSAESDAYFSPNASTKSFSDSAILTDSSTYHSRSTSGPRPRPCLGRTQLSDSQIDDTKKSIQNSSMESIPDSVESAVDAFLRSNIVSSTFIDGFTPKTPRSRARLSSISHCASAVLSSDTSIELTQPRNVVRNKAGPHASKSLSVSPDASTKRDSSADHLEINEKSNINSINYSSIKTTVLKKKIIEEVANEEDDDELQIPEIYNEDELEDVEVPNEESESEEVEIIDEIEKESEIKTVTKGEFSRVEIQEKVVERSVTISSSSSDVIELLDHTELINNQEDDHDDEIILEDPLKLEEESIETIDAVQDKESIQISDDEDELMALKYDDEEENEIFKSLHNSIETDHHEERQSQNSSVINVSPQKTPISKFYEEYNITDDESSTSVHSEIMEMMVEKMEVPETLSPATTATLIDDVDITDDETDISMQSARHSQSSTSKNTNEDFEVETGHALIEDNDDKITIDEGERLPIIENIDKDEMMELPVIEIIKEDEVQESPDIDSVKNDEVDELPQIQDHAEILSQNQVLETDAENVVPEITNEVMAPTHMTRKRRASSVAPSSQESNAETLEIQNLRTRRANSLAKDIFSPAKTTSTITSSSDSPIDTPTKRGRGRRSVSLIKEVLTTALPESTLEDISESPVRRSARRAASVQKEIMEPVVKTHAKNKKVSANTPMIEEKPDQDTLKTGRGRRAASVAKDDTKDALVEQEESVSETSNSPVIDEKPHEEVELPKKRGKRAVSVSKDAAKSSVSVRNEVEPVAKASEKIPVIEEKPDEDTPKKTRRKRAVSASQDVGKSDVASVREIESRGKRAVSASKDVGKSDVASVREIESRGKRAVSASKDVGKSDVASVREIESISTLSASIPVTEENPDEGTTITKKARGRRAVSVTNDVGKSDIASIRKIKSVSEIREVSKKRDKRAVSVSKDTSKNDISVQKETEPVAKSSEKIPVNEKKSDEDTPKNTRGRRALSASKDLGKNDVAPVREKESVSASPESIPVTEKKPNKEINTTKKTRGRRAASVSKDFGKGDITSVRKIESVSTTSESIPVIKEQPDEEITIAKKTRGRRAASESKDLGKSDITSVRKIDTVSTTSKSVPVIKEEPDEEITVAKKTRGRRAASVSKDFGKSDITSVRKIEPVSTTSKSIPAIKEEPDEEITIAMKTRGRRAVSVSKDVSKSDTSVQKEVEPVTKSSESILAVEGKPDENTNTKKTKGRKAVSVNKNVAKNDVQTEADIDTAMKLRGRRAVSVSKSIDKSDIPKELEYIAEVVEPDEKTPTKKIDTPVIEDNTDKQTIMKKTRGRRAADIAQEIVMDNSHPAKKARATSGSQEGDEEVVPRKRRAVSVPKETKDTSISRRTRAASVTKDDKEIESINKRATRRRAAKDEESVKTKKGSVVNDVIPEEDDEDIFDSHSQRPKKPRKSVRLCQKTRGGSVAKEVDEEIVSSK